ncbi:MAG: hypothetical protein DSY42_04500 [Aquifex sp.]|nr:MAG: hypothetical protein DSY42_04500 [Aquifex sp.]
MRWTKKTVEFLLSQMGFSVSIERINTENGKAWLMRAEKLTFKEGKYEPLKIEAFGTTARFLFEDFVEKFLKVESLGSFSNSLECYLCSWFCSWV